MGLVIYLIIAKTKAAAASTVAAKAVSSSAKVSGFSGTKNAIVNSESVRLKAENNNQNIKDDFVVVEDVVDIKKDA